MNPGASQDPSLGVPQPEESTMDDKTRDQATREMTIARNIEKAGGDPEFTDGFLAHNPRTIGDVLAEEESPKQVAQVIRKQVEYNRDNGCRLDPGDKHQMIRRYLEACFRQDLERIQAREMGYRKPYDLACRYKRLLDEIVKSYALKS